MWRCSRRSPRNDDRGPAGRMSRRVEGGRSTARPDGGGSAGGRTERIEGLGAIGVSSGGHRPLSELSGLATAVWRRCSLPWERPVGLM